MSISDFLRAKTVEYLGEDGLEHLQSLRDDLTNAGDQLRETTREVWEDCGYEDTLNEAKEFYHKTGTQIKQNAEQKKAVRKERQKKKHAARQQLRRKAIWIFAVMILLIAIVITVAFQIAGKQKNRDHNVSGRSNPTENVIGADTSREASLKIPGVVFL